jgi:NADH-quinone oxidoreductase subunit G
MSDDQNDTNDADAPTADDVPLTDQGETAESEQLVAEQVDEAEVVAEAVDTASEAGTSPDPDAEVEAEKAAEEADDEPEPEPGVLVTIDGREHRAKPGQLVIDACQAAGSYVPHFCYHPRMTPVGMCRQCLVEVEGPRGTMMVVSCMTPVAEGQVVNTATPTVKRAQEGILELLLANHPLDCPVCDKGGECPLQDQAFSHGPGESRYVEQKRHYEKPIPISDLVYLDRERCILCDRCTRFADEVAGDKLISFISRGNDTQVMTFPDEPFSSYFSGNTVQICPVGALTAKPYRFKARPWDLEQLESTCTTCAVGCKTVIQSSRDELLRYQGVDSEPVNWGWLCDRGRFNFEAVNSERRLTSPMVRGEAGLTEVSWGGAVNVCAQLVREALDAGGADSIGLLGGARGTNEDAFAWAKLADALGIERRDAQFGDGLPASALGLPRATIAEAANASTIVLLGPDLKEELPVLYLRLRDAAEKRRSRILEFSAGESGLTRYAWKSIRHEPGRGAAAVAATVAEPEVAEQLASGPVVVVLGRANLAESPDVVFAALTALLAAAPDATVLPAFRRGNVVGALQLGLAPATSERDGLDTLRAAADGKLELLVLLGADPISDCPDTDLARRALAGARRVISVDTFINDSSRLADVVLAAAAYGEKSGTTTNLEGRVTRVAAKVTATGTSRPDWMIAAQLGSALGHDLGVGSVDDLTDAIAAEVPAYAEVTRAALDRHRDGIVAVPAGSVGGPVPSGSSHEGVRNSYDYRLVVSRKLYDRAVGTAMSPSLAPLAPTAAAHVHPLDLERVGVTSGTAVKIVGVHGSVVLPLVADATVQRGTLWSPFNAPTRSDATTDAHTGTSTGTSTGAGGHAGSPIGNLIGAGHAVVDVRIERL